MLTILEALRNLATRFDRAGLDQPNMLARRLIAHVTSQSRESVMAHTEMILDLNQIAFMDACAVRVLDHEPLAYVVEQRSFFGMDLFVDHRVLIPRPETELLVELTLTQIAQINAIGVGHAPVVIEIGTGSGAAAIAIAREQPNARVTATDVSPGALEVARINARRMGVDHRLNLIQAHLLAGLSDELLREVQIIIANLPYIAPAEIAALQTEIVNHEPHVALDGGGADGLDLVRALLAQIKQCCATGALRAIFLEHGATHGPLALAAARAVFPTASSSIIKDLAKLDRVLAIQF